jgi:hypothetical protein
MKVVLRHQITGRYYRSPGTWVRRADNALAFEDAAMALQYCRMHQLAEVQPVHRLAPYLMPLLSRSDRSIWTHVRRNQLHPKRTERFVQN